MPLAVHMRAARVDDARPDLLLVSVRVGGGRAPLTCFLYVDGDLVASSHGVAGVWALSAEITPRRHALTVRAIDAAGRWGAQSMVVEPDAVRALPPPGGALDQAARIEAVP